MSAAKTLRLSKVNNVLLALILLINAYLIGAPVLPALVYGWRHHQGRQSALQQSLHSKSGPQFSQPNHLVIPAMALNAPVYEGSLSDQYKVLRKGIWRYSRSSTPDKGSNTVLIGHRFTYTEPKGVFYYLNKVGTGDEIGLWWNNKKYLYRITSVSVVPPNDTAIESPSQQPELTLFTCTPLWLPKDRLVVVARLETAQ